MDIRKLTGYANIAAAILASLAASGVIPASLQPWIMAAIAALAGIGHSVSPPLPPKR